MFQIGDEVIIMSFPGVFRVVSVKGNVLTIENEAGLRKTVLTPAVRKHTKAAAS